MLSLEKNKKIGNIKNLGIGTNKIKVSWLKFKTEEDHSLETVAQIETIAHMLKLP